MKYIITVLISALLISCGGGGGSTTPTDPTISNFVIIPASGIAGTTVTITVSHDYSSTNGLSTAYYTDEDGEVTTVDERACTSSFSACFITVNASLTSTKGTYSVSLYVVDTKGNKSNTLSSTFTVT